MHSELNIRIKAEEFKKKLDIKDGVIGPVGPEGKPGKDGESIVGPMGPSGKDGESIVGPQGPAGKDGLDGLDSTVPGPKGDKGDPGKDGLDAITQAPQIIEIINPLLDFNRLKNRPEFRPGQMAGQGYLKDLADVSISNTLSVGQVIKWDGSKWINSTDLAGSVNKIIAGTNVTISPISGLGDVTINATTPDLSGYWKSDGTSTATGNWDLNSRTLTMSGMKLSASANYLTLEETATAGGDIGIKLKGAYPQFHFITPANAIQWKFYANTSGNTLYFENTQGATNPMILRSDGLESLKFTKTGGTSSQFLKADGSVDSSTYLTASGAVTSLTGTANQITASASTGAVTLSLPTSLKFNSVFPTADGTTAFRFFKADGTTVAATLDTTNNKWIYANRLTIPDGTVSNPSISFTSDDDGSGTGFYRTAANSIGTAINGVLLSTFSSTGINVPIRKGFYTDGVSALTGDATNNNFFMAASNPYYYGLGTMTGTYNIGIGSLALNVNLSGGYNTAIGYLAMSANDSGINNVALGPQTLQNHVSGNGNVAIAPQALLASTLGSFNIAIGQQALTNITGSTPSGNTAIGYLAGRYAGSGTTALTNINNSTFIGREARASAATGVTAETVIGYNAVGNGSNTVTIGGSAGTGVYFPYGGVRIADGTAAIPAFGFLSDDDGSGTGFYRSAANRIGVSCNGTFIGQFLSTGFEMDSALSFTFNNRGGLGTSVDKTFRLSANGGANLNNFILGQNDGTGFGFRFDTTNGAMSVDNGTTTYTRKFGVGIAPASVGALVHLNSTTEQLRVGYDTSNYYKTTVGSTGGVTFDAVGTGANFTFSDDVQHPTKTPASATATGVTGTIAWDASYIYICTATDTWKRVAIGTW